MANSSSGSPTIFSSGLGDSFRTNLNLVDIAVVAMTGIDMQMPFRMGLSPKQETMWLLPLEPKVSVRARNEIAFRNINKIKAGGTVKELWSNGDYQVGVEGIFISDNNTKGEVIEDESGYVFPDGNIIRLDSFCRAKQSVYVDCHLLNLLGINLLTITEWEFPATDGVENQYYRFTGISDQLFELL